MSKELKKLWKYQMFLTRFDKMLWGTGAMSVASLASKLWNGKELDWQITLTLGLFVVSRTLLVWCLSAVEAELKHEERSGGPKPGETKDSPEGKEGSATDSKADDKGS